MTFNCPFYQRTLAAQKVAWVGFIARTLYSTFHGSHRNQVKDGNRDKEQEDLVVDLL